MTREEAKKIADLSISTIKRYSDLTKRFNGLIDEIYDDFESRVCENCKHHKYIEKSYRLCEELEITTSDDFCCNLFERR